MYLVVYHEKLDPLHEHLNCSDEWTRVRYIRTQGI